MIVRPSFFQQSTLKVARALIGMYLVHESSEGRTVGRIVETEAYLGARDAASHAYRGKTVRNAAMFGNAGTCYVYFIYGVHYCVNVVCRPQGTGEAVLIRALEPIAGITLMRRRRRVELDRQLCNGPGKLVEAMGITKQHNGASLMRGRLRLLTRNSFPKNYPANARRIIAVDKRIGIRKAAELPYRYFLADSEFVSRH